MTFLNCYQWTPQLYPQSLSLIRDHYQLFPAYQTIIVTHICHIYPHRCKTNCIPILPSCVYSRSESNQISRRIPKYSTTYAIIHFCLFSLLQHDACVLHPHMIFYTNHYACTHSHSLPSEITQVNCCYIMKNVPHIFLSITYIKHTHTHHPPK